MNNTPSTICTTCKYLCMNYNNHYNKIIFSCKINLLWPKLNSCKKKNEIDHQEIHRRFHILKDMFKMKKQAIDKE